MITETELFAYVSSSYPYEQKDISIIDEAGRQIIVDNLPSLMHLRSKPYSIKIESMEKYSEKLYNKSQEYAKKYDHKGPVTCHLFWARAGDFSFSEHVDLDDVVIFCADGKKHMTVEGNDIFINEGEELLIPKGVAHEALNTTDAITLSFGLERFSIEKA